ncbi:MAG: carbamoyltransferase C-terminal domain-containing protein [Pirellulaceae bacterium]
MYILGLHGNFGRSDHDGASALICDNQVVAVAEEERFLRQKHATGLFPYESVRSCLQQAGITIEDVDYLAFPRVTWGNFSDRLQTYFGYQFGHCPEVKFIQHHRAHVASAYHLSGFSDALALSVDRSGDGVSLAVYRCQGTELELLHEEGFPNSIGLFAALMTQYLGFRSNHGEYKVMGLSAFGKPDVDLSFLMDVTSDGYRLNDQYLHEEVLRKYPAFPTEQLPIFNEKMAEHLPPRRTRDMPLESHHADLAASTQATLEAAVSAVLNRFKEPDDRHLCLCGGVAHNSVMNGNVVASGMFESVYVPAAAGDAGTALGAAVQVAVDLGQKFSPLQTACLGPQFDNGQIQQLLDASGANYETVDDPALRTAQLLADGATVAWFQGRAEFGPRALGARSLLANPCNAAMKDKVNLIKHREKFRPFAPSALHECCPERFSMYGDSRFMSFTFPANDQGLSEFPAAIHVDGSARVQSVRDTDGLYYQMISHFHELTGIPAVLNTSLNSSWEPIVHRPEDALAFLNVTATEYLSIGNFLVSKAP